MTNIPKLRSTSFILSPSFSIHYPFLSFYWFLYQFWMFTPTKRTNQYSNLQSTNLYSSNDPRANFPFLWVIYFILKIRYQNTSFLNFSTPKHDRSKVFFLFIKYFYASFNLNYNETWMRFMHMYVLMLSKWELLEFMKQQS